MARPPARIQLTAEEESTLREWTRKGTGEQRLADRARIVLLSHEGMTVEMIAEHLHTRPARISKWRHRAMRHSWRVSHFTKHARTKVIA